MKFTMEEARELLTRAGLFFDDDEEVSLCLNMNDVWMWACADGEDVPNEELPRLAELFWRYGWCGVLYWVSERNGGRISEFMNNNRFIDFVKNEEDIRQMEPSSDKRAYLKCKYTLGEDRE